MNEIALTALLAYAALHAFLAAMLVAGHLKMRFGREDWARRDARGQRVVRMVLLAPLVFVMMAHIMSGGDDYLYQRLFEKD